MIKNKKITKHCGKTKNREKKLVNYVFLSVLKVHKTFLVTITLRKYPYPSRTRKSSLNVPTILEGSPPGR